MNIGKVFEGCIHKSIPDYALLYRLPDSAQSFGGGKNLRFSKKNPFDFLMWDSVAHILFALELKTVQGKSISFERDKSNTGIIHLHQIEGLSKWSTYDGIVAGFIIEFRAAEKTIFIKISDFIELTNQIPKKSFRIEDLDKYKIPYLLIPQTKLRKNYKYDIDHFIEEIRISEENK